MTSALDNLLADHPVEGCPILPATHATVVGGFEAIVDRMTLEPTHCDVFKTDLVYLFYGGVYYSHSARSTMDPHQYPVAFVFRPSIFREVLRFYPFDTGGLVAGHYGKDWRARLANWKQRYALGGNPNDIPVGRLIEHLFGSNFHYHRALPQPSLPAEALVDLIEFLRADLTIHGADVRQRRTEAHAPAPIQLGDHLAWVGFPEEHMPTFARLWRRMPYDRRPKLHTYEAAEIFNPLQVVGMLDEAARNQLVSDYLEPGRR